jgi:hypothetical protein
MNRTDGRIVILRGVQQVNNVKGNPVYPLVGARKKEEEKPQRLSVVFTNVKGTPLPMFGWTAFSSGYRLRGKRGRVNQARRLRGTDVNESRGAKKGSPRAGYHSRLIEAGLSLAPP